MKKIAACIASMVLAASLSLTAFAASGIDANEQAILDKLNTPITVGNQMMSVPAEYYNQAENYLKQDGVSVTDAQKTQVLAKIDEATEILQENGTTDLLSLPKNVRSQLVTIAQDAAKVLDLNLTYDNVNKTITVVDKNGDVVAKVEPVVKTTGADTTAAVMTAVTLVALLAGCAVVACKSKLAAK